MDKPDFDKDLRRIFAEYANFFTLPISTSEEHGDVYTQLPRSLFANLMLRHDHLLEQLNRGILSLKELRDDCESFQELVDNDLKSRNRPETILDLAGIPERRRYLYLAGDNKGAPAKAAPVRAASPPPPVRTPISEPEPEYAVPDAVSEIKGGKSVVPFVLLGLAVLVIVFFIVRDMTKAPAAKGIVAPPTPIPAPPTETPTASPTATVEPPTPTSVPYVAPAPKPKPKPPPPKPEPTLEEPEQEPVVLVPDDEEGEEPTPTPPAAEGIYKE